MLIAAIRELNHVAPFRPYALRLTSGKVHRVPHPDFVAVAPKGSWVMVADENDHPFWISALLIEEVTLLPSTAQAN
ncbi:MAG: hypothetical protein EXS37_20885 [Opitutus sp.]|nr:hypothetical protein [Opitutus sp.]